MVEGVGISIILSKCRAFYVHHFHLCYKDFFFFGKKHILRLFRRETQTPAISVRIEQ